MQRSGHSPLAIPLDPVNGSLMVDCRLLAESAGRARSGGVHELEIIVRIQIAVQLCPTR